LTEYSSIFSASLWIGTGIEKHTGNMVDIYGTNLPAESNLLKFVFYSHILSP